MPSEISLSTKPISSIRNKEVLLPSLASIKPKLSYRFYEGRHEVHYYLENSTPHQIEDIMTSKAQVALVIEKEFFVLLCQFGNEPWQMSPFQWHRLPKEQRIFQPNVWEPALLEVSIVDMNTDQTYAQRTLQLDHAFTASLCGAILVQAANRFDGEIAYEKDWENLTKRHPTAEKLLPFATARTLIIP